MSHKARRRPSWKFKNNNRPFSIVIIEEDTDVYLDTVTITNGYLIRKMIRDRGKENAMSLLREAFINIAKGEL